MSDSHQTNVNMASSNKVSEAHTTCVYINHTSENVNGNLLDTKLLVNVPIEFDTFDSISTSKTSPLYIDSINAGEDAAVNRLDEPSAYEFPDDTQSPQLILDNNRKYSCLICVNDNNTLNSVFEAVKYSNGTNAECNNGRHHPNSSLEENEYSRRYSTADIDELPDCNFDDCQLSIVKVQNNSFSYDYFSSSNSSVSVSEADGEVLRFLDESNIEVRINIIISLDEFIQSLLVY